jgi:beta-mannosidase
MTRIDITNDWQLLGAVPKSTKSVCEDATPPPGTWLPAKVPGDVNADLLEAGQIPNPHYDTQAQEAYWITAKEWWYRTTFTAPPDDHVDLCFDGVDGTADLWLNDIYFGCMENAFHPHRFSVSDILKPGENELRLRFRCLEDLLGSQRMDDVRGWYERRAFLRKPQYNFGWDWSLPLPSIGLGGGVWLDTNAHLRFCDLSVRPILSGRLDFAATITPEVQTRGYSLIARVEGNGFAGERRVEGTEHTANFAMIIDDPVYWYPNGFGQQALYDYQVDLLVDEVVVDTRRGRSGLRKVELLERPFSENAGPGYSFEFVVNKEPIFCKGANWIPLEIWPATVRDENYAYYLRRAQEAGFNMIRVWGGGVYERDRFYDLCDELGIMVWQDFMFASAGYPVELLRDEITTEATYQLQRLRNHPSIVLWCGCNEDVFSWQYPNTATVRAAAVGQGDDSVFGTGEQQWTVNRLRYDPQLYTMLLRGLAGKLGLGVPYIESSPQSRNDFGNMPNSGNCHISCWKYALFETDGRPEKFRDHFEATCSFNSEFCIQGPSSVDTIRRFLAPENHWPPNDAWIYHIQRGHANLPHHEQTRMIAGANFGKIDSLETYVKYGQAMHVEMTRSEYESARRDRPNNGGTMSWMLNDCWPTSNWSIIDYFKWPKPSFYAAKRSCRPVVPIIFERCCTISIFVDNQRPSSIDCELAFGQASVDGKELWKRKVNIEAGANECTVVYRIERSSLELHPGDYLFVDLNAGDLSVERLTWFPDGWRDVEWPETQPLVNIAEAGRQEGMYEYEVTIEASAYTRLCHLIWDGAFAETIFSDNYFDMPPATVRSIHVSSTNPLTTDTLTIGHWMGRWGE